MESVLEFWRVIAVQHCVQVKGERNACVAELRHAVHWLHAPGHSDLVDALAEASYVTDDIHESRFGELGTADRPLLFLPRLVKFRFKSTDLFGQLLENRPCRLGSLVARFCKGPLISVFLLRSVESSFFQLLLCSLLLADLL